MVTETWLSSDILDNEIVISGYNLARKDRNRHGGGLVIYVRNDVPYKRPFFPFPMDIELVIVECLLHSRLLTIAGFSCPPNSSPDVLESVHSVLSSLRRQNFSNLVLCGDFNIDPRYSRPNDSLSLLQSDFQLTQVINEPTRVSPSSSSMIDIIFLSNPTTLVSCGTEAPLAN